MLKNLYLNHRFFFSLFAVALGYVLGFLFLPLFWLGHILLLLLLLVVLLDFSLLFSLKKGLLAQRFLPEKLSNGDENKVKISVKNEYPIPVFIEVIDEIPFQFQERKFSIKSKIEPKNEALFQYILQPKIRGIYQFGGLNVFVKTTLGLVSKRFVFQKNAELPCYPSFIHLQRYELMAVQNEINKSGIRKIRKLGHTMEFEQIRDYVLGDDVRSINWKATSKRNQLMINQFQDEKSQNIVMLIDKGRTMQMPFGGLTLLDFSINATMNLSHIILKKGDKAGVMAFSKKIENKVPAVAKNTHLKTISEALYKMQTDFSESDYGRLYQELKHYIKQRSLVLLFSNFETLDALNRQMKYLRAIAKQHLLVVVFFKNSEIENIIHSTPKNIQEVYNEIVAEKLEYEKKLIIQELKKYGIRAVYTAPEELNIAVINQYLQIKAQGIL